MNNETTGKPCRGLVIQNNPFSYQTGNGKTIASMLSEWECEELAQIYVSDLQPDFSICRHYFKMSDKDALKSLVTGKAFGHVVGECRLKHSRHKAVCSFIPAKLKACLWKTIRGWAGESSFAAVIRDLVWQKSNWKNHRFCEWLDSMTPAFVYLIAGNISVFYDMALFICERYDIPLYVHIGDDYFIYRSGLSPWKNLHRRKMSDCLDHMIAKSDCVFAISEKLARVFRKKYGGRYFVCMNSVDMDEKPEIKTGIQGALLKLVYAGNLGIGRWKVLRLIGQALLELREEGICAELEVYSSYIPEKNILRKLNIPPVMRFCGSRYGEELEQIKKDADMLVHVEAFGRRYRQLTYTAMSTKISEYLAAGKIILAMGPKEAASMEFLKRNDVAVTVTEYSKKEVKEQIRNYFAGSEKYMDMSQRAFQLAGEKFSRKRNARRIYQIISRGCMQ